MHENLPDTSLDIVGDIHGELDALTALLAAAGYDAAGRHPEGRTLVFVGDLVDRGPDSPGVVALVRELVFARRAVAILGNHELNLLRNERKHGNDWFWNEGSKRDTPFAPCAVLTSDDERRDMLDFFASLPLLLSRPDLRVTHAAWHAPSVEYLAEHAPAGVTGEIFRHLDEAAEGSLEAEGCLARAKAEKARWNLHDPTIAVPMLEAIANRDDRRQMANPIRVVTSGIERKAARPFFASGEWRFAERVRWWDEYADETPVVVGHYWRQYMPLDRAQFGKGDPDLFDGIHPSSWLGPRGKVFCIDFSVGGRYQERLAGAADTRTRLALLRWPERDLLLETGERVPTTGFGGEPSRRPKLP